MLKRLLPYVALILTIGVLGSPTVERILAQAPTAIGNTAASLVGKFLVDREDNETITGLKTFSRSTNPPFAVNSGSAKVTNLNADLLDGNDFTALSGLCGGRLSLTSGTPVTTADVTGATSIYWEPYGIATGVCGLYDGSSAWTLITFTETTLALGTLTSGLPYDVFAYNNGGTLAVEALAWASTTARATALTTQNGVYVKTAATTRRYLGTFYTTATTTTEDSYAKRFLWNYYNRVPRPMRVLEATVSWVWGTAGWHSANAAATNQVALVVGVAEQPITVTVTHTLSNASSAYGAAAIGQNSTTVVATGTVFNPGFVIAGGQASLLATLTTMPAVGYSYFSWIEFGSATGTETFYGVGATAPPLQSGIVASMLG